MQFGDHTNFGLYMYRWVEVKPGGVWKLPMVKNSIGNTWATRAVLDISNLYSYLPQSDYWMHAANMSQHGILCNTYNGSILCPCTPLICTDHCTGFPDISIWFGTQASGVNVTILGRNYMKFDNFTRTC